MQGQEELSLPHRTRTGLRCQRQSGKFAVALPELPHVVRQCDVRGAFIRTLDRIDAR